MEKMKSIVFVSYYFPPINSIAVKRNYFIAKALKADWFEEVNILTTNNRDILPNSHVPLDNFNITALKTLDYRRILSFFGTNKGETHFSENQKMGNLTKWMIRINDSFPFNLLFGEGGLIYIVHGSIVSNRLLRSKKRKYIFSSFRPSSNIWIGYISKKLNPSAIWISNFHDIPVDQVRNNVVFPKLQHWFWKKILKPCDLVITVSEGVASHLKKYNKKVQVIENGVVIRKSKVRQNNKFVFCYTGSLYGEYRNPTILFQVLKELILENKFSSADVEIRYAGKDGDLWKKWINEYELDNISKIYGDVTPEQSLSLQEEAHINILLTWSDATNKGILTGKLFEYLGSTNAIIGIVNGPKDEELEKLFERFKCGTVIYPHQELDDLKIELNELFRLWKSDKFPDSFIHPDLLSTLNWETQVGKLMSDL